MMNFNLIGAFGVFFLFFSRVEARIFGGHVTWRPVAASSTQVYLDVTTFYEGTTCTPGNLLEVPLWSCSTSCTTPSSRPSQSGSTCGITDTEDNWSINHFQETYTVSATGQFSLTLTETVGFFPQTKRTFLSSFDNGIRSDTGRPNYSPVVTQDPIIRIKSGCATTIKIPVTDNDGDNLFCRYATGAAECGDFCTGTTSAIALVGNTCTITYDGTAGATDINVALMIEDRPTSTLTVGSRSVTTSGTITSVPLQFTIKIYTSAASCTNRPNFTSVAPSDGQAFSVAASNMFQQNLVVSSSTSVNKFTVVGLTNAVTSSTVTSSAGNTYSYSFNWTATSEYMGANVLCFSAEDTAREESGQRCVYVQVTDPVTTSAIVTTVESTIADVTTADVTTTDVTTTDVTTADVTTADVTTADITTVSASTVHMTTNAAGTTTGTNPCLPNNGNCSDICTWSGGDSYQCSCSNACWHLAADQRNCIPQVHFECGTEITASVEKCATSGPIALNNYDPASPPPGCAPTENATHNTFAFGYNHCGTIVTESANDITYNNFVRMLISTGASTVTRESWYSVNVVCSFPKFGNLTGLFDPTDNLVNFLAVPGLGFFTFSFKFFVDSTYQSVYTTEPVIYPLNADVYFALTATGGSGLSLFTQNCSARPDEASSAVSYPLISDGCLQDSTMRTYTAPNAMQNRFSIKAFRFLESIPGLTNETNVIISCSVIICVGNAPSTRCSLGCINSPSTPLVGRRRRFVDSEKHDRYRRDSRPVQTNETVIETSAQLLTSTRFLVVEEKQAPEVSINWLLILLAVGAAVGVAAALGICCRLCFICAVRRRKRKERDAEGRTNDAFEPTM